MLGNNFIAYAGKTAFDLALDIVYFPVWWYTRGTGLCAQKLLRFLSGKQKTLGLWIWIKNLHRPMYGQYDWQGMLISFFMRLFQIILRGFVMLVWLFFGLVLLCLWLLFPIFVIYQIIFQLYG